MTRLTLCCALLAGCAASTNDVSVTLAPEVISSIDGKLDVHALVLADADPQPSKRVDIAVDYTDRNGTAHTIAPVDGTTDKTGAFDAQLTGLTWDGSGTVTVTVTGTKISNVATFAVLDRTPPKATIEPPATVRVGMDTTVNVHVTDEIGVSQVWFEWDGPNGRARSTVVASGSTDTMVGFDLAVPDTVAVGTTLTLYALAEDLSSNQGAAMPIMVTVSQ